ncbi:MAG TPA: energy transducer TonB [Opitutaceae bacterium]
MVRKVIAITALLAGAAALTAESPSGNDRAKTAGFRKVVLHFFVDDQDRPQKVDILSSEAGGLNQWAEHLVLSGQVKIGSPAVAKVSEGLYLAKLSFPIEGDGEPLSNDVTFPVFKQQTVPAYPFELVKSGMPGGAVLRFTLNEKAKISDVQVVRASHRDLGLVAKEALKRWRAARPAMRNGEPIAVTLNVLFIFQVDGQRPAPWEWQVCPEPGLDPFVIVSAPISK